MTESRIHGKGTPSRGMSTTTLTRMAIDGTSAEMNPVLNASTRSFVSMPISLPARKEIMLRRTA